MYIMHYIFYTIIIKLYLIVIVKWNINEIQLYLLNTIKILILISFYYFKKSKAKLIHVSFSVVLFSIMTMIINYDYYHD